MFGYVAGKIQVLAIQPVMLSDPQSSRDWKYRLKLKAKI